MTLRVRLLAAVIASLALSLALSGSAFVWHARRSVGVELRAALQVGGQTAANAIGEIAPDTDVARELGRIVRTFDGDRHVRATLLDGAERPLLTSEPLVRPGGAPEWFTSMLSPRVAPVLLSAGPGRMLLVADPRSEAGEVWTQVQDAALAIVVFCLTCVGLIGLTIRRALAPLDRVSAALKSLGAGDLAARVPQEGTPELVRVATAFNAMSGQLELAWAQNERLSRQIAAIADEERTELARDLHDEVGPFLFAVHLDAAVIERAAESPPVIERAIAIREAVAHMQRHVRSMLNRLRNVEADGSGLPGDLRALIAFWRSRKPQTEIALALGALPDGLREAERVAIYRVAQEGLMNAMRHGQAGRVGVSITTEPGEIVVRIEDDGAGFGGADPVGWGLVGLRERTASLGGSLSLGTASHLGGSMLEARLPIALALSPT